MTPEELLPMWPDGVMGVPPCNCELVRPGDSWGSYSGPSPDEWAQAPDCPVHPLVAES